MKHSVSLLITLAVLLAGCASAPMASPDSDRDAKKFSPAAGSGNVYVARRSEMFGMLIPFKLLVDGQDKGTLAQGTYQLVAVAAGQHKIEVTTGLKSVQLTVDVAAGKNYFYSTGAQAGEPILQPELSVVLFEEMGKLMVSQAQRAPIRE